MMKKGLIFPFLETYEEKVFTNIKITKGKFIKIRKANSSLEGKAGFNCNIFRESFGSQSIL